MLLAFVSVVNYARYVRHVEFLKQSIAAGSRYFCSEWSAGKMQTF